MAASLLTRRRRRRTTLLAAGLAAALIAGCGGGGGSGDSGEGDDASGIKCPYDALAKAKGPVEITVWNNYAALAKRTFDTMVAQYNASQDKVKVNVQTQGVSFEETLRKYKLAAEDDKLPNLALLEDTVTQVMADSGTVIPGGACYEADKDSQRILDDFLPIAVASYTADGELQPVGFDVYTAVVFYNRRLFAQAGLDPDKAPATLDEVKAMAEKLKAAGVIAQGKPPVAAVASSWQVEWWLTGVKQEIVNNDDGRSALATKSEFASKQTTRLFDFWKGMVDQGLARFVPGTEGQRDHLFAMATNSAAMVVESSAGINTIAGLLTGTVDPEELKSLGVENLPALDLDLGVGPYPGLDKSGQGQIGGGAWYLTNAGTEEQQAAAWDFMKWFNATPQQVQWALTGSGLPVVQSAVDDPKLQEQWKTTLAGKWNTVAFDVLQNVDTDFPGPLIGDYKVTREQIRNAYESVVLGGGAVQPAIDDADKKITAAVQAYEKTVGG